MAKVVVAFGILFVILSYYARYKIGQHRYDQEKAEKGPRRPPLPSEVDYEFRLVTIDEERGAFQINGPSRFRRMKNGTYQEFNPQNSKEEYLWRTFATREELIEHCASDNRFQAFRGQHGTVPVEPGRKITTWYACAVRCEKPADVRACRRWCSEHIGADNYRSIADQTHFIRLFNDKPEFTSQFTFRTAEQRDQFMTEFGPGWVAKTVYPTINLDKNATKEFQY